MPSGGGGPAKTLVGGIHSELRPFSGLVPASRGGVKRRALGERTARIKLSFARLESWAGSVGFVGVDGDPGTLAGSQAGRVCHRVAQMLRSPPVGSEWRTRDLQAQSQSRHLAGSERRFKEEPRRSSLQLGSPPASAEHARADKPPRQGAQQGAVDRQSHHQSAERLKVQSYALDARATATDPALGGFWPLIWP